MKMRALILAWLLAASGGAQAALITAEPDATEGFVGDEFIVDVVIDPVGELVGVFDIDVLFDPGILAFSGVVFDIFLDGPGDSIQEVELGSGVVSVFELSWSGLFNQDGAPFRLFSLAFTALAAGSAQVGLDVIELGDFFGDPLIAETAGTRIDIRPRDPAAVPEPGALGLLAVSLFLLSVSRRRPA
ncbi:cohesin domain-containing protein [Thioalkalivibrio sp. XN8]|uniref:cohesin domain-containing protein n=1 Tax=Thioalkalivibrio sp. XN8 TaxID=2712863 RepID=UPI0013ED4E00|nr:cohesin domain-containing protein [Thioalkalivibrio sp. XN8]NGP53593.1 PEP-CTERM sorting domain-containing protein [Thioalkalivibrio sp. XN8]